MPDSLLNIGLAVSLGIAVLFSVHIGRSVSRAGVEHFSGRILIFFGIINTVLCGLLLIFQGTYELFRAASSGPLNLGQLLIPLVLFAAAGRIVWNHFRVKGKTVSRFALTPHQDKTLIAEVGKLSIAMGILPPEIMSSDKVVLPFVFGRRSKKAILAVPANGQLIRDDRQKILLLHELAHVHNRDVGFLAWANACIRDMRWLIILFPAMAVYCFALGYRSMAPSILLYLACAIILFVLLRYVIRRREFLADMTAALLGDSGDVTDTILRHETNPIRPAQNSEHHGKASVVDKIQRWLSDKAMFAKRRKMWGFLLRRFDFFYSLHPPRQERAETVLSARKANDQLPLLGDSFWAGVAIGLLGVTIALGGYWFAVVFQNFLIVPNDHGAVWLPYQIYGMLAMAVAAFLVVFLVLPTWSSLKLQAPGGRFLLSFSFRYGLALLGAWLVCPLILTAGAESEDVLLLLVLCAIWCVCITVFSFAVNIVIVFLWMVTRYIHGSRVVELRRAVWAFSLFIVVFLGLVSFGAIILTNGMVFRGVNIIVSMMIGAVLALMAFKETRLSIADAYLIFRTPLSIHRFEGKLFKRTQWTICSIYYTAAMLLFASLLYLSVDIVFAHIFRNIGVVVGTLVTCVVLCSILALFGRREARVVLDSQRIKIVSLVRSFRKLPTATDCLDCRKIEKVVASYDICNESKKNRVWNLTVCDVDELVVLLQESNAKSEVLDRVLSWLLECQCPGGGFGVWPGSSPRLSATYEAISILKNHDSLAECNADTHASWIKTLQQPDGFFRGPWSNGPLWKNTFHAVKSLDMLGVTLHSEQARRCRKWCDTILSQKGFARNNSEVIYHCLGTLEALGPIDEDIRNIAAGWTSTKIEQLLLTNIALNYEQVYLVLMTYALIGESANISSNSLDLLAQRVKAALDTELACIRI